jgi:hypothetical protein
LDGNDDGEFDFRDDKEEARCEATKEEEEEVQWDKA